MTRVKIKCKSPEERGKKIKLLEILCSSQIQVTKIFNASDGFAVLLLNEEQADRIFTKEIKAKLDSNGFNAILPPELKVKKSIIITRVDDIIYDRNTDEIADEIMLKNNWITDDVDTVYKFPRSNTIKVTFTQTNTAKKCTEKGLLAFNLSIPHTEIKQETYIQIQCCMRCYQLEKHNTKDCTKDQSYKICSECSGEGHLWHQCTEKSKKCINCGDEHSTMAMKCAKRKEILKEKRKQETEKNTTSFANIAKKWTIPPTYNNPASTVTSDDLLKINVCILHAHYRNIENPGSYENELNKILKLNNLPTVKVPETPNSSRIFNATAPATVATATPATQKKPVPPPRTERLPATQGETGARSKANTAEDTLEQMENEILDQYEGKDLGIQIYVSEEVGWPQGNFNERDLIMGINKNIYKWTYTTKEIEEDQIIRMIKERTINLRGCFTAVDKTFFRKIRNGLQAERSPLDKRDPRHRKTSP